HNLQEQRPFAEPSSKFGTRSLVRRQTEREQPQGFAGLHGVDGLANGRRRRDAVDPGGQQTDSVWSSLQERPQVLLPPRVVDDHQDAAIPDSFTQLRRGGVDRLQRRPLAYKQSDEIGEGREEPLRFFAEFGP